MTPNRAADCWLPITTRPNGAEAGRERVLLLQALLDELGETVRTALGRVAWSGLPGFNGGVQLERGFEEDLSARQTIASVCHRRLLDSVDRKSLTGRRGVDTERKGSRDPLTCRSARSEGPPCTGLCGIPAIRTTGGGPGLGQPGGAWPRHIMDVCRLDM